MLRRSAITGGRPAGRSTRTAWRPPPLKNVLHARPTRAAGAERLAVKIVVAGRSGGVSGLPDTNDWTVWNADEMRAAVEHLQRKRGTRAPRR